MPLLRAEWWEAHQPLVVFMWIILLVVPFAIVYGAGDTFETVLECIVNDYLTFIVLLFGLFCVSGNITVGGDFAGSPRVSMSAGIGYCAFQLYWNNGSQYAHGSSGH